MHSALCSSQRSFIIDTQIQLLPSRTVRGRQATSTPSDGCLFGSSIPIYPMCWGTNKKCPILSCSHPIADTLHDQLGLVGPPEKSPPPHLHTETLFDTPTKPCFYPACWVPYRDHLPSTPHLPYTPLITSYIFHKTTPRPCWVPYEGVPPHPQGSLRKMPRASSALGACRKARSSATPPPQPGRHVGPGHPPPASSSEPSRLPPMAGDADWRHPPLPPGKVQEQTAAAWRADGGG